MFTPQQIDQIAFSKATFGGYNMQQVDEFLEPLTEDYVTLYKENALLKSKMRVLVGKLEEYRKNEAAMKEAVANANAAAAAAAVPAPAPQPNPVNAELVAAENARVEEARRAAASHINEIQDQMRSCINALERIKSANAPATPAPAAVETHGDVASEISQSIEALVGTTEDTAPVVPARHPVNTDSVTSKFASLNLQFGRNYDTGRK